MGKLPRYEEFSVQTTIVANNKYGFRSETCYGSGISCFADVLNYETKELGNVDIYLTMRDIYGIKLDLRKNKDKLNDTVLLWLMLNLHVNHTTDLSCVWLCSDVKNVSKYYGNANLVRIDFSKTQGWFIVSDLAAEGCLVVFPTNSSVSKTLL